MYEAMWMFLKIPDTEPGSQTRGAWQLGNRAIGTTHSKAHKVLCVVSSTKRWRVRDMTKAVSYIHIC